MLSQNIYYQEERRHAGERFVVLVVLTLVAFVLSGQSNSMLSEKAILLGFVLLVVDLLSVAHYYFIANFPTKLVEIRKLTLLAVDVALLTFAVLQFGEAGIFLLPLYTVIIMRAGFDFGVSLFYTALFLTAVSWFVLYLYSPYWQTHTDILAAFGISALLVPLFYLKYMIGVHEEYMEIGEDLAAVDKEAHIDGLTGIANRKGYKQKLLSLIQEKTPFTLIFINVNKLHTIYETHGKHVGDEVIKEVVRRLEEYLDKGDFLARLGGDELALISLRDNASFDEFLLRLERGVIGRLKLNNLIIPIELNMGIARYPDDTENAMILGKYADDALKEVQKDPQVYHCYYHELNASLKS